MREKSETGKNKFRSFNSSLLHLKYNGGWGRFAHKEKQMELLLTTEEFNRKYARPKRLDSKGSSRWKEQQKKIRKERKYKKRIPKSYKLYIKSKFWTERKNRYYKDYKKFCKACLSNNWINLHHMVYGNYGFEKDEHLVALCQDCHEEFHSIYGVKRNLTNETYEFIIEKRELLDFPIL